MNIGDSVEVLDDTIQGKIIKICTDKVTIVTSDGFELTFNKSEVIKTDREQKININSFEFDKFKKNTEKKKKYNTQKGKKNPSYGS